MYRASATDTVTARFRAGGVFFLNGWRRPIVRAGDGLHNWLGPQPLRPVLLWAWP